MTEIANEIGKTRRKTQPWVTDEMLNVRYHIRDLKKTKNTTMEQKHLEKSPRKQESDTKKTGYKKIAQKWKPSSARATARGLSKL